jgi:ABC-2 type transport system permease protein
MTTVSGRRSPAHVAGWRVATTVAGRGLLRMRRLPSLMIPATVMPVFFVVAFSGTFSSMTRLEAYGTDKAVNWMAAWAILQGSAFSGIGAAGAAATDLEGGFHDRLRIAPANRWAPVAGLVLYAQLRALLPITAVLLVAAALGASMPGGVLGVVMVYAGGLGMATVIALLGLAIAFRLRSVRSLALVQLLVFTMMFLSIGQAPLEAMRGWLRHVARLNPITYVVQMTRQGFLADVSWGLTWRGLVAMGGLGGAFAALLYLSYRRLDG